MKSLVETVRNMYSTKSMSEATMMKDDGKVVHNCAQHVEHATWGQGRCISEQHADPDRYGNIAWYDIEFPHGVETGVPVSELRILQSESHGHSTKKAKKMAEAEDLTGMVKKSKKNNSEEDDEEEDEDEDEKSMCKEGMSPEDRRRHQELIRQAERLEKTKPYGWGTLANMARADADKIKRAAGKMAEEVDQIDELSKDTLGSYVRKAASSARNRAYVAGSIGGGTGPRPNPESVKQLKIADKRVEGIRRATRKMTEDLDFDDVDETIIHRTLEVSIDEAKMSNYDAHFRAMMKKHGINHPGELETPEKKKAFFNAVDASFKAKNEDVFLEEYTRYEVQQRINAHEKAGNKVTDVVHSTKDGMSHHSFVVTQPSGKRSRHIYHGNSMRHETMSPAPKSKMAHETGEDEEDK